MRTASSVLVLSLIAAPSPTQPLGTAFTYRGSLVDAGFPGSGRYDVRFTLSDDVLAGATIGPVVDRQDVVVIDGAYTIELDFGLDAFGTEARFLEVALRPAASSSDYEVLPRVKLLPEALALFALSTPWWSIQGMPTGFADGRDDDALGRLSCTTGQVPKRLGSNWICGSDLGAYTTGEGLALAGTTLSVADGGVTSSKLGDGAVTSAKIANGTIVLADLGQNGCATGQVLKWSGTSWACAPDVDTTSGGTVTRVSTGAGLSGGPITQAGTVSVAAGGITSAMIANGAVGLAQIDTAQVQARVAGACPPGATVQTINGDGSVTCVGTPPQAGYVQSLLDVGAVAATSITIGQDGLGLISYIGPGGGLRSAHCSDVACTRGTTALLEPIGTSATEERYTAITVGADGLGLIAYYDFTNGDLKVAHCANVACTSATTAVVDSAGDVGRYPSITTIGSSGRGLISYYDHTNTNLKVAYCSDLACSSALMSTVDSSGPVGRFSSITSGADGQPLVSYTDDIDSGPSSRLKVARCFNYECTTATRLVVASGGRDTSIAIAPEGLASIVHIDTVGLSDSLMLTRCTDMECSTSVTTMLDDTGARPSLALGSDGLPAVFYKIGYSFFGLAHCATPTCSSVASTLLSTSSAPTETNAPSLTVGQDGLPLVSYRGEVGGTLGLVVGHCSNALCTPFVRRR